MENFEKRKSKIIIKVCGMRDGQNIQLVSALGVDWIGMVFGEQSPRNVTMIPTHAGIIPDRGPEDLTQQEPRCVGVFTDEMAQNVITRVVNFRLDAIQLNGQEPATLIRNLRATLTTSPTDNGQWSMVNGQWSTPIAPHLQIWKGIRIETADDLKRCADYEDCVDMFVFYVNDLKSIGSYDGTLPFLLGGNIGPDDAEAICAFRHPRCIGIDLDEPFESAPAMKDVERLQTFIENIE